MEVREVFGDLREEEGDEVLSRLVGLNGGGTIRRTKEGFLMRSFSMPPHAMNPPIPSRSLSFSYFISVSTFDHAEYTVPSRNIFSGGGTPHER